jgi:two-component system LytT family response regulator
MIRSIIVDDELKSRENLKILLTEFSHNVEVQALCESVKEAITQIEKHKPDVVFLDIQMRGETGFDLLKELASIEFEVVFTTAYSEYAIKAFQFSAIDYLLKPIDISDLHRALKKITLKNKKDNHEKLTHLLNNLNLPNNELSKIALPTNDGLVFIDVRNILYLEASSNYTKFHLENNEMHLVCKSLKEYETILINQDFFRIHHSFLINLNYIKKYVRGEGGYVIMANDQSLNVSKRKKEYFLRKIGA